MKRRFRSRLLLVVIALLGLSNVAAICFGSGAHKVFTHADGFIILDSTGALFGTTDDGESWEPTRSLPRERTKYADEVCVDSGCYRIRSDRLGIEAGSGDNWSTVWEYPAGRVSYLGRQLPGLCGDGHAEMGLIGMAPTYEGSRWEIVVAAGPDGVMGLDNSGDWVRDVYTEPASETAGLSDVYLVPELLATGLVLLGIALVFGYHDRSEVAGAILASSLGWGGVALMWHIGQGLGITSTLALFGFSSLPLLALGGWCLNRYCDLGEIMVGAFFGGAIAISMAGIEMSHGDFSFGIVLSIIGLIVLASATVAARDQIGNWPLALLDWLVIVALLVVGGLLVLGVYSVWVWGWIESRLVADGLVFAVALGSVWSARKIWLRRGDLASRETFEGARNG